MYIVEGKRFFALDFVDNSDNESKISYVVDSASFSEKWSAHTRVSPVWRLVSEIGTTAKHADCLPSNGFVFFAGPINPALLDVQFGPNFNLAFPMASVWASLGVLNLIISTTSEEENDQLREFLLEMKVVTEIWTIDDGTICEVDIPKSINGDLHGFQIAPALLGKTKFGTVAGKELELLTTGLTAQHRGAAYFPWLAENVADLVSAYANVVEGYRSSDKSISPRHESDLIYILANINSGLSRFTSQSLSGTAPIRISECHFWPHSFLGTGLCNATLHKCISFVESTLGKYNIVERFKALSLIAADSKSPNLEDFRSLNRDLLAEVQPLANDPLVTPVSYFSGRDNFKNDLFTVSVPLDTISGLNSKKWSILTVTHELSHRFVEPIISYLIPIKVDDLTCTRTKRPKYSSYSEPINYLEIARRDFLRCALAYAASIGYNVDAAKNNNNDSAWVLDILKLHHMHIEEIFVHVFDFLYFYDASPSRYVPDIWNSWGVLPHIETKLDEYIVRTAAALLSNKVTIDQPFSLVRKEILDNLPAASENPAVHLDEVRRRVESDEYWQRHLLPRCEAAELSARFVLQYLYSDIVMPSLRGEQAISSSTRSYDYDFHHLKLDTREFENPISFLSFYATDIEPDETKSLWLYTMLAFALENRRGSN